LAFPPVHVRRVSELRNPRFPAELLESAPGDGDRRNVIDAYRYWETEAIAADLDERRHDFAVILENFAHDFNIGSAVRNCNAFLGAEVFILGRRGWDRRGAVGTHHYEHVTLVPDWREMQMILDDGAYSPIVFDNIDGAESLTEYTWPARPAMIFGQEQIGVSPTALELADDVVFIPQFGSTRSINVGVSSGIAMYDFVRQAHSPRW
jgi:tRNA G18 (ribose-2'-O)-methylase SpoU